MGGGTATLEPGISDEPTDDPPYWAQDGVHEIYRDWRQLLDEYPGDRDPRRRGLGRPAAQGGQLGAPRRDAPGVQLRLPRDAVGGIRRCARVIDDSHRRLRRGRRAEHLGALATTTSCGTPRRLALTAENLQGHGIGPKTHRPAGSAWSACAAPAPRRALMLALPGSAYIYQGEELGLPEAIDLPDDARQDPTWFRTNGERYGRDGCRVPHPLGGRRPRLRLQRHRRELAAAAGRLGDLRPRRPGRRPRQSTLELYRAALRLRREHGLGLGALEWLDGFGADVVAFRNGGVTVIANTGSEPVELPGGRRAAGQLSARGRGSPGRHDGLAQLTTWKRSDSTETGRFCVVPPPHRRWPRFLPMAHGMNLRHRRKAGHGRLSRRRDDYFGVGPQPHERVDVQAVDLRVRSAGARRSTRRCCRPCRRYRPARRRRPGSAGWRSACGRRGS